MPYHATKNVLSPQRIFSHLPLGFLKSSLMLTPMPSKKELLDLQFIDVRHKLIDIAAFLDRIDRHPGDGDFRYESLKTTLPILLTDRPDRARAVLEAFSDHSTELPQTAHFQGAVGAPSSSSTQH
jgi:hypothetical protein